MKARFPRLSATKAGLILKDRGVLSLAQLETLDLPSLETEQFAPTGPERVQENFLLELRADLRSIAGAAGYPSRSEQATREFDGRAAICLAERDLPIGQAIRSDTWAWIAVHLVPHLVHWRYGSSEKPASFRRYSGILQRNAIGRLWYRAHVMREDEGDAWATLGLVNEDAHVAVLERTSIAKDHRLAKATIRQWHKLGGGEDALRAALIRIRLQLLLQDLSELSDSRLLPVLDWAFDQERTPAGAIGAENRQPTRLEP